MSPLDRARSTGVLAVCVAFLACEQIAAPPTDTEFPEVFQTGTVADAASHLDEGAAAHAAITLSGEGLLAHKIRLSPPSDREAVVSRLSKLTTSGTGGSMTLVTGGLTVTFDGNTKFLAGEGEAIAC